MQFCYDPAGRRVKKEDTPINGLGHTYYCVWSGEQLLVEFQTMVGRTFAPGTEPEQAASTDDPANLRYLHRDMLSVRLVTNGNGQQVDTQTHDVFGRTIDPGT